MTFQVPEYGPICMARVCTDCFVLSLCEYVDSDWRCAGGCPPKKENKMTEINTAGVGSPAGPLSAYPMNPVIAAEFVTALVTGASSQFLVKYGIPSNSSPANWIAVAKLICAVANVICPIVGNL